MNSTEKPSLFGRAVLALLLTIGFYGLALVIALGLLYLIYLEIAVLGRINVRLTLFAFIGAVVILWSILPRIDRFSAPGPRLTRERFPGLFSEIEKIANLTGQKMPRDVYLIPDVNAFVAERGGAMGIGTRRVMGIGLPLFHLMTVDELKAVLAHEFGHFYGGDTALGPWIYRTRSAIIRTVMNVGQTNQWLLIPFEAYARMFLRVTNAVSRQQEYSADRLAARTMGAGAIVSGLQKIHKYGEAFAAFFRQEYLPVIEAGYRPPMLKGFELFLKASRVVEAVNRYYEEQLTNSTSDPNDTHPSLKERLAALENLPAGAFVNDQSAASLLSDSERLETLILHHILVEKAEGLKDIAWDDVPETAFVPQWKENLQPYRQLLNGLTPLCLYDEAQNASSLFGRIAAAGKFLRSNVRPYEVPPDVQKQMINNVFGSALALALLRNGWKIRTGPGEDLIFVKDAAELQPFTLLPNLMGNHPSRSQWQELCESLKIGDLSLAM